jgi:hypothetical protein
MKKVLIVLISIITLAIITLFVFQNNFTLWNITNKYKTDPSSLKPYSDIPEEICEEAREEILNSYLANPDTSKKSLMATIDLVQFFRSCSSSGSRENQTPLHKKSFDVLIAIYSQTKDELIRYDIAHFLRKENLNAFYKYFEITQENDLLFYDGTTHRAVKYPQLYDKKNSLEKDLWCKNVSPQIEADFIALLEADTFKIPLNRLRLLSLYEKANCNNDILHLRKLYFSAWSELLVNLEKQFRPFQTPKDLFKLRAAEIQMSMDAKNELETSSLISILNLSSISDNLKAETRKNLLLYILDYPLKSRAMCFNITSYFARQYAENLIGGDVIIKTKAWLKLVDEKYPELNIEQKWQGLVAVQNGLRY